jgi:hypothetical protein
MKKSDWQPHVDDAYDLILALRGGHPEKCDHCGVLFTEDNVANPAEAGQWICYACMCIEMGWEAPKT